jgi:hypothetical protein
MADHRITRQSGRSVVLWRDSQADNAGSSPVTRSVCNRLVRDQLPHAILTDVVWPNGLLGRALAGLYVAAWAGVVAGLVWGLRDPTPGFAVWVVANVLIWALAVGMRRRVPMPVGARMTGYQRAWYRLILGLELPAALQRIRGKR